MISWLNARINFNTKTIFLLKNISRSANLHIGWRKGNIYLIATTLSITNKSTISWSSFISIFLVLFIYLSLALTINSVLASIFRLSSRIKSSNDASITSLSFFTNHRSCFKVLLGRQNDAASTKQYIPGSRENILHLTCCSIVFYRMLNYFLERNIFFAALSWFQSQPVQLPLKSEKQSRTQEEEKVK